MLARADLELADVSELVSVASNEAETTAVIEEADEAEGVITAVTVSMDDGDGEAVDDDDDAIDNVFFTDAVALPLAWNEVEAPILPVTDGVIVAVETAEVDREEETESVD